MPKKRKGQGLVEFALILPVLLLLFCLIIEFGRLFHAYTTVQNAAREGARYAVTGQTEEALGLNRVQSIKRVTRSQTGSLMVDPNRYWDQIGTPPYSQEPGALSIYVFGQRGADDPGGPGERVRVQVVYNMPVITPLLMPIASRIRVVGEAEMINEGFGPTGKSHGGVPPPTLGPPPTEGPPPTATLTPTPGGPTATITLTPSPTPTFVPLYLDKPVVDGQTFVTGGGQPGQTAVLRDLTARRELGTVVIGGSGYFMFTGLDPMVAGHVIAVLAYGQVDYTEVLSALPSTPTPTATPTGPFIVIPASCGNPGATIRVYGYQWPNRDTRIEWKTVSTPGGGTVFNPPGEFRQSGSWSRDIVVPTGQSRIYIYAAYRTGSTFDTYSNVIAFDAPCPPTATPTAEPTLPPTPTPAQVDLIVESIAVTGTVYTYQPTFFDVTIRNIGSGDVNSMFWNDLFIGPANPAALCLELGSSANVDWAGVSSLGAGMAQTIRLTYPSGFTQTGTYSISVYSMADTLGIGGSGECVGQVFEIDETNNYNGLFLVTVITSPFSTPTPTPTSTPGGPTTPPPGSISGATWIWVGGNWTVPQGRVTVKVWQGSTLVATTYSSDGYYLLNNIPAGSGYRVTGEVWVDNVFYYDERVDVTVNSGQETRYIDLLLVPLPGGPPPTPTPAGTPVPTSTPTPAPGWVTLTYDDFESGWGSYTDGGPSSDCDRYTGGTYAHQGSAAIHIQDNSTVESSFAHTSAINVATPGYTEIRVEFWFRAEGMSNGHDFWVQYYDGSAWRTVAVYTAGTDFNNSQFYNPTVTISEASYTFPTNMRIRFMCDAQNDNNDVYIDEVRVSAR